MTEVARVEKLGPDAIDAPHATLRIASPAGADVAILLHDGSHACYHVKAEGSPDGASVEPDPFARGNAFRPLHEGPRSLAALVSIAAGRRMESGPESERAFLFLRGSGLVFLENGDTMRYQPLDVAIVPAGETVRVWAQGPEDALAVVLQPRMAPQPRRTLASEIAKLRPSDPTPSPRSPQHS